MSKVVQNTHDSNDNVSAGRSDDLITDARCPSSITPVCPARQPSRTRPDRLPAAHIPGNLHGCLT